jgi:hypothetical protein
MSLLFNFECNVAEAFDSYKSGHIGRAELIASIHWETRFVYEQVLTRAERSKVSETINRTESDFVEYLGHTA